MNAIASFTPPVTLGGMLAALGAALLAPNANSRASLSRWWRDLRIAQREATQADESAVVRVVGHLAAGLQHLAAEGRLPADDSLRAAAHACSALSAWVTDREEQHAAEVLLALSAIDWLHDYHEDAANALAQVLATSSVSAPAISSPAPGPSAEPVPTTPPQQQQPVDGDVTDAAPVQLCLAERELIQQALGTQVLPALAGQTTPESLGEIGFNLSLIANALAAIGLEVVAELSAGIAASLTDPASLGACSDTLDALAEYFCAVTPDPDIIVARVARHARTDWPTAHRLAAELRRVEFCDEPAATIAPLTLSAVDLDLSPAPDVLANVLASMLRELPQHAQQLGDAIRAAISGDRDAMEAATRIAHTLKGDANTVGIRGLAHLTHVLEDALLALARAPDSSADWALPLQSAADLVEEIADHLGGHAPAPLGLESAYNSLANLLLQPPEPNLSAPIQADAGEHHAAATPAVVAPTSAAPAETTAANAGSEAAAGVATLSIDTGLLDQLQKLSAELLVLSRQLEQQLGGLSRSFNDLTREIKSEQSMVNSLDDLVSLRGAALRSASLRAGAELDALELDQYTELHGVSRRIMEANTDHQTLALAIQAQLRQIEDMRSLQEQVNDDLNRLVQRARALPFRDIAARLQRVVRQTARTLGKEARLDISGGDTLIDAEVLQALVEPLSHALRNALDHGIEPAELRLRRGKPVIGVLRIAARPVGDLIAIEIEDDGNGLDETAILGRARAAGLIDPQTPADPALIARLVSRPGFTTRDEVTQTSGRGVGMDVIARRIQGLRGQMALHSVPNRGTRLVLRIPASQALVNVAVARGGDLVFAVAADAIEQVVSMSQLVFDVDADGQWVARFGEARLPLIPMEALGGDYRAIPASRTESGMALLVRSQDGRRLVTVDAVEDIGKVIVKPLSPLLPAIPAVRGICQLGDGRLAPVIDIDQLLEVQRSPTAPQRTDALAGPPCIVVADDSLSVRRAIEQLLQDAGFRVSVARDGLEAINQILALRPAAVLLDLEMPKMNGLEVTRFLRTHEALAQTPVVMVTSRASGKYQVMANEAGVDRLVGKPYSEDQLVTTVRELLAAANG